jgi:hypothetical protein
VINFQGIYPGARAINYVIYATLRMIFSLHFTRRATPADSPRLFDKHQAEGVVKIGEPNRPAKGYNVGSPQLTR